MGFENRRFHQEEIAEKLNISRTTVWEHLKKIKETGVVLSYEGIDEKKMSIECFLESLKRAEFESIASEVTPITLRAEFEKHTN